MNNEPFRNEFKKLKPYLITYSMATTKKIQNKQM
tara:strand:+ start:608 stop:709 length:102 start_codon:yes stop_codon:yes gene_type:complete